MIIVQRNISQGKPISYEKPHVSNIKHNRACVETSTDVESRSEWNLFAELDSAGEDFDAGFRSLHNYTYEKKIGIESETNDSLRIQRSEIIPYFCWRATDDMSYGFEGRTCVNFMCFILMTAMCSRVEGSELEVEQ